MQLLELILTCCKDATVVERISKGGKYIQEAEVKVNLPDDIVNEDISNIEKFFFKKAWTAVNEKGNTQN